MRWIFWVLLIIALATGVSLLAGNNDGFVLIVAPPYRLELSPNLLLLLIALVFVMLHFSLRLIHYTRRLPANVRAHKKQKRLEEGHRALIGSLHSAAEGHFDMAEKAAAKALNLGEDAGLSALIAARSSHKLNHKQQRDFYLAEAERLAPQAIVARLLMQAEFLVDDRQYSQALEILQTLEKHDARCIPALRLKLKVLLRLQNWEQAQAALQKMEKLDAIESWHVREVRQQIHRHLIQRYSENLSQLTAYWEKIPEEDRLNSRLAGPTARAFNQLGAGDMAAGIVEMNLADNWDSELARLFGDCASSNPQQQLQQAEYWLASHPQDAQLLLSIGKLCIRLGLWGKARNYLEASLSVQPDKDAHLVLAELLENQGNREAALEHYRLGAGF